MGVGENIKRLRKVAKMTQEQLAEASGLSPTLISRYERAAERKIGVTNIAKIAKALKCEVGDIDERCDVGPTFEIDDEMLKYVAENWERLSVAERAAIVAAIAADVKEKEPEMVLPQEQIRRV